MALAKSMSRSDISRPGDLPGVVHLAGSTPTALPPTESVPLVADLDTVRSLQQRQLADDPNAHGGREFDIRYGVDTAGHISMQRLKVIGPNRRHSTGYAPIHNIEFDFGHYLSPLAVPYEQFTFVDLGSGKGRALLLAAMLPFLSVVGVEFAGELVAVARENVRRFPIEDRLCGSIELLHMDAVDYEPPATPLALYLWNPFERPVMERVVANLATSYRRSPRRMVVMYFTPDLSDIFDSLHFLRCRQATRGLRIWDTEP